MNRDLEEQDALLVMRYADGELEEAEARAFEARLRMEPALEQELARLRELEVLARAGAPPEPGDHAFTRLTRNPLHTLLAWTAWALLGAPALALLFAWLRTWIAAEPFQLAEWWGHLALTGSLLLLVRVGLERMVRAPFDPYRDVQR